MWCNNYELKTCLTGRLDYNKDLIEDITSFCENENITSGYICVLGALKSATLGFYNQSKKLYDAKIIDKTLEIVNCYGNISIKEGKPFVHIHLVVSDSDYICYGGHAMPGCIVFAGEIFIFETKGPPLIRQFDEITSLYMWPK